jgi:hemerythrin
MVDHQKLAELLDDELENILQKHLGEINNFETRNQITTEIYDFLISHISVKDKTIAENVDAGNIKLEITIAKQVFNVSFEFEALKY